MPAAGSIAFASLPDPAGAVLLDVLLLTLTIAAVGLVVFGLVRRWNPLLRWESHGNVFTGPFNRRDMIAAGGLLGYYLLQTFGAVTATGVDGAGTAPSAGLVLLNIAWQFTLGGLILFYLGFLRRLDLDELFGLRRLSVGRVLAWAVAGTLLVAFPAARVAAALNERLMARSGLSIDLQLPVRMLGDEVAWEVKVLVVFAAVIGAALSEEILFRGFLYPVFKRFSDRFFAILVTSMLFAAVHVHLGGLLPLFVLGVCFAVAFELTGSLWVPIVMHALFNGLNVLFVFWLGPEGGAAAALWWLR